MHIARAQTLARRDSVQTEIAQPRDRGIRRMRRPNHAAPAPERAWKYLPGAILLTVLVMLGGLFPVLF